jgi:apolipoprotein N-acyltransferase
VALIQGSFDTQFVYDREKPLRVLTSMYELSVQAVTENDSLDMLIWPETTVGFPLAEKSVMDVGPEHSPLASASDKLLKDLAAQVNLHARPPVAFLLGADVRRRGETRERQYNSAFLLSPRGQVLDRYDKMYPVWFGEYIPLGDYFPWTYRFSPLRDGLDAGERPAALEWRGVRFCPSVCYESILPHHVRQSVATLRAEGREPHVLVNLTNSGWFWGSSELDLHLICNVFRAVECRKPMLVAANTGFSAWIDHTGRIKERGPRRAEGVIVADAIPSEVQSVYSSLGDWPAGLCLLVCLTAALHGLIARGRRLTRRVREGEANRGAPR